MARTYIVRVKEVFLAAVDSPARDAVDVQRPEQSLQLIVRRHGSERLHPRVPARTCRPT